MMDGCCLVHGLPITTSDGKCLECYSLDGNTIIPKEWTGSQEHFIDLQSQLTAKDEEIERLKGLSTQYSEVLESQLTAANAEIERLKKRLDDQAKTIRQQRTDLTAANAKLEKLQDEILRVTGELSIAQGKVQDWEQRLGEYYTEDK